MTDVKKAYDQIVEFLSSETDKSLLLCGIADKDKHRALLKALNAQGELTGLVNLIHTTKSGVDEFFRWAGLYEIKGPKKYGQAMKLLDLTIYFDNISTNMNSDKYDDYEFDFMIIWPIVSVTKNEKEIQMLKEMIERQKTKKIVLLTIKEPWYSPNLIEPIADRVIKLDCENDNPDEFKRILAAYDEDKKRRKDR
ncbi:hypothetical protein EDD66_10524 [Mobilisporobacter senegalensis]|uniref:Uncharacterized protein n=1 Tax=Mobilisporobacter senegalensis TaxID=1329262 RepID=A0A3N1XN46_9FIRM|nr:hypothetical protein [Mobilisporobacter senegalensis]ROR28086.1 hypothetical protein EDD66_10524 [Mobilisporobacter senegalensis]